MAASRECSWFALALPRSLARPVLSSRIPAGLQDPSSIPEALQAGAVLLPQLQAVLFSHCPQGIFQAVQD